MKTRFCDLIQSPDAGEGASEMSNHSNYSMERTPITELLFQAKQRVLLPVIRSNDDLASNDCLPQARKVERSFQEQ